MQKRSLLARFWLPYLVIGLVNSCEFDFWVFDGLRAVNPNATSTLVTDGECRSIGIGSPFNFPGYYRATCDGQLIRFLVSGCDDSSCLQCNPDPLVASTLYADRPINIHPTPSWTNNFQSYVYSHVSSRSVAVYFVAYGTCSACPQPTQAPVPPSPSPTKAPTYPPTNWPTRQPTEKPTHAPISSYPTRSPSDYPTTLSPVSPRATYQPAARASLPPTDYPTRSQAYIPIRITVASGAQRTDSPTVDPIKVDSPTTYPTTPVGSLTTDPTAVDRPSTDPAIVINNPTTDPTTAGSPPVDPTAVSTEQPVADEVSPAELMDPPYDDTNPLLSVNETPTGEKELDVQGSNSKSMIGYGFGIAGGMAVLGLVVSLAVVINQRQRKGNETSTNDLIDDKAITEPTTSNPFVLVVDRSFEEEISTLGGGATKHQDNDQPTCDDPTASVNNDFDFERNDYRDMLHHNNTVESTSAEFSNESPLQRLGGMLFRDDDTFEQQFNEAGMIAMQPLMEPFEVVVPPGRLGMVVDSAVGGLPPIVRSLAPTSILHPMVRLGDQLLSVNNQDATKLSARAISNMISDLAGEEQKLVFVRVEE